MTPDKYEAAYRASVGSVVARTGAPPPGEGRVYVVDAGLRLHNIPMRDVEAAKDCRFISCRRRETPCLEHPRTEWGK